MLLRAVADLIGTIGWPSHRLCSVAFRKISLNRFVTYSKLVSFFPPLEIVFVGLAVRLKLSIESDE